MTNFFDPNSEYQTSRRNLPHWNQEGVTYFVTFHLADSLPAKKLDAFKEEKNRWLDVNRPPLSETQLKEYHQRFSGRIQHWLDAGSGSCVLARPEIQSLVEGALKSRSRSIELSEARRIWSGFRRTFAITRTRWRGTGIRTHADKKNTGWKPMLHYDVRKQVRRLWARSLSRQPLRCRRYSAGLATFRKTNAPANHVGGSAHP